MPSDLTPEQRETVRRALLWGPVSSPASNAELDEVAGELIDAGWTPPAQPDAISAAEARGRREGVEAAAKEVLDWQGRVAMGSTHANAAHDETLARIADHVRGLSSIPPQEAEPT